MSKAHAAASEGQCAPRRAAPSKHSPIGGERITRSEKREGFIK